MSKYKAKKTLQKALQQSPRFSQAYNNLGDAFNLTGQYGDAIKHYQIALKLNPSLIKAHSNLADIYANKIKDENKAHYHLKKAESLRESMQHTNNSQ